MRARARRTVANAVCELGQNFTPSFAVPGNMVFGDTPSEGSDTRFSRADHKHGMPTAPNAIIDAFTNTSFLFSEMMWQDASGPFTDPFDGVTTRAGSAPTFDQDDDPGVAGGFGTVRMATGIANAQQASGYTIITQPAGDSNDANHDPRRMRKFQCRAKFARTVGAPEAGVPLSSRCAVGAVRTATFGTTGWLSNIFDGIYFRCDVDGSGNARWFAVCTTDGNSTEVDTGVDMVVHQSVVDFQMFTILFDGTVVTFYIDDSQVASISDNIPTSKVAGWGTWFDHSAVRTNTNIFTTDHGFFLGTRV